MQKVAESEDLHTVDACMADFLFYTSGGHSQPTWVYPSSTADHSLASSWEA